MAKVQDTLVRIVFILSSTLCTYTNKRGPFTLIVLIDSLIVYVCVHAMQVREQWEEWLLAFHCAGSRGYLGLFGLRGKHLTTEPSHKAPQFFSSRLAPVGFLPSY